MLTVFYIGIPVLALVAGLLSRLDNKTVTTIFNILMLVAVVAGAVFVIRTGSGWIHILSFIAMTILGNLVGVLIADKLR